MDNEIWKTYPDYPWIEGSSLGRVRTKDKYVTYKNGSKHFYKGYVLKQYPSKGGYMRVHFSVNGKLVNLSVHRIIASCFISNPISLPEVNHIDNNPTNNHLNNLEWCSHRYNMQYREKYGVSAKKSAEALIRPVFAINLETQEVLQFPSQRETSQELDIAYQNINKVIKGQRRQAGGYWFTNADNNAVEVVRAKFGDEVADKVAELMTDKEMQPA